MAPKEEEKSLGKRKLDESSSPTREQRQKIDRVLQELELNELRNELKEEMRKFREEMRFSMNHFHYEMRENMRAYQDHMMKQIEDLRQEYAEFKETVEGGFESLCSIPPNIPPNL